MSDGGERRRELAQTVNKCAAYAWESIAEERSEEKTDMLKN